MKNSEAHLQLREQLLVSLGISCTKTDRAHSFGRTVS